MGEEAICWISRQAKVCNSHRPKLSILQQPKQAKSSIGLLDGLSIPICITINADRMTNYLPPALYFDHQGALSLARNLSHHSRTKHNTVVSTITLFRGMWLCWWIGLSLHPRTLGDEARGCMTQSSDRDMGLGQ